MTTQTFASAYPKEARYFGTVWQNVFKEPLPAASLREEGDGGAFVTLNTTRPNVFSEGEVYIARVQVFIEGTRTWSWQVGSVWGERQAAGLVTRGGRPVRVKVFVAFTSAATYAVKLEAAARTKVL